MGMGRHNFFLAKIVHKQVSGTSQIHQPCCASTPDSPALVALSTATNSRKRSGADLESDEDDELSIKKALPDFSLRKSEETRSHLREERESDGADKQCNN